MMNPHRMTVAVVDDDQLSRDLAVFALSDETVETCSFASGEELIDALPTLKLDCILLDVNMPGISGLDVQKKLNAQGVRTPVVMFTADQDVPTAIQAMRQGAVDYVIKPIDPRSLRRAVDEATKFRRVA